MEELYASWRDGISENEKGIHPGLKKLWKKNDFYAFANIRQQQ